MARKAKRKKRFWNNWSAPKIEYRIESLSTFALLVFVVVSLWYTLGNYYLQTYFIHDAEASGQRGDTYGIVNSLFSALAFAGLFYTILIQRKELKETKQEFITQNATLRTQRFENTFFSLLDQRHRLISQHRIEIPSQGPVVTGLEDQGKLRVEGLAIIESLNRDLTERLKMFDLSTEQKVNDTTFTNFGIQYNKAIHYYKSFVPFYVGSLHSILKFAEQSNLIEDDDRQFYFNIIRTHLSLPEKMFLYYYMSIAPIESSGGKYRESIREIESSFMFNDFVSDYLIHSSHIKLQFSWGGFDGYEDDYDPEIGFT
jgi:hypothetical protein